MKDNITYTFPTSKRFTNEQLNNLKKGRDYLFEKVSDERFHMTQFNFIGYGITNILTNVQPHKCGTLGCALGWMVEAPELFDKVKGTHYLDAAWSLFGLSAYSDEWQFLFSGSYVDYDNTKEGAIGRIDTILNHPDLFMADEL